MKLDKPHATTSADKVPVEHIGTPRVPPLSPPEKDPAERSLLESLGMTTGYFEHYINQRIEYTKLEITEILSVTMSAVISAIIIGITVFLALLFVSFGLGFWLSEELGSVPLGFAIIGAVYLILTIVVYAFRKQLIVNRALSTVLTILFNKK